MKKTQGAAGLLLVGILSITSGCTWVKVDKSAESVLLVTQEQAQSCERLRRTTSQVLHKVGFLKRDDEKQQRELQTLARNTAAELGGNAILPDSEVVEGKQSFLILNCPQLK